MPEAWCANCGKAATPMIVSGWGFCKSCREGEVRTFEVLKTEVTAKETREWLQKQLTK